MLQFNESSNYSHREVAIDCPDNFVPQAKTRPSYPFNSLTKKEKEKEKEKSMNTLTTFKSKFAPKEAKNSKESKDSKAEPFKIVQSAPKIVDEAKKTPSEAENEIKRREKESEEALLSQNSNKRMQSLKEAGSRKNLPSEGNVNSGFEHDDDEDATNRIETDSLDAFDDLNEVKIKSVEHVVVVTEPKVLVHEADVSDAVASVMHMSADITPADESLFKIISAQNGVNSAPSEQNTFKPIGKSIFFIIFYYLYCNLIINKKRLKQKRLLLNIFI